MKYPNLNNSKIISFDIETRDPNLIKLGSGEFRRDGHILGVAISDGNFSEYYNIGHYDCKLSEKSHNIDYLKTTLENDVPKLGTNIKYDMGFLQEELGITVNGRLHDIQIAEPLLDEYARSFSLDSLAMRYLNEHKKNNKLLEFCERNGLKTTEKKGGREHIHLMSYAETRDYGIGDVDQPIKIFEKQYVKLTEQDLLYIYDLECRLIRPLLLMKKNGVRIDQPNINVFRERLFDLSAKLEKKIYKLAGREFNIKSTKQKAEVFDSLGLEYPRNAPTEKMRAAGKIGNPSIDKDVLIDTKHPITDLMIELGHYKTLDSLYLSKYESFMVDNRIHAQFEQLKSDVGGTITGRFSGRQPNLQQVSKEEEFCPENSIRKLFIPEEDCLWLKNDWSQIEYRILAHYATGQGAQRIKDRYSENPNTDYHSEIGDMTNLTERPVQKKLNFGALYEMGYNTMHKKFHWELDYARNVHQLYHVKVPFVKHTSLAVQKVAKRRGYIKTLLGRRARLEKPEFAYKMLNKLIQGSAGDVMKKAIVDCYEAGVFNSVIPHITVHDELDCSMPLTQEGLDGAAELKRIMETCVKLDVPIISDAEIGNNWNDIQDFDAWNEYIDYV